MLVYSGMVPLLACVDAHLGDHTCVQLVHSFFSVRLFILVA